MMRRDDAQSRCAERIFPLFSYINRPFLKSTTQIAGCSAFGAFGEVFLSRKMNSVKRERE